MSAEERTTWEDEELDDASCEAFFARSDAALDSRLSTFADDVTVAASGPSPVPSASLAAVLEHGLDREAGATARTAAPGAVPFRRRLRRRIAAAGLAAKVGVIASATVALGATTASVTGYPAGGVPGVLATAVDILTPFTFDRPAGTTDDDDRTTDPTGPEPGGAVGTSRPEPAGGPVLPSDHDRSPTGDVADADPSDPGPPAAEDGAAPPAARPDPGQASPDDGPGNPRPSAPSGAEEAPPPSTDPPGSGSPPGSGKPEQEEPAGASPPGEASEPPGKASRPRGASSDAPADGTSDEGRSGAPEEEREDGPSAGRP